MSVARGFPNAGHYYSNIVKPIAINCNFTVDSANGNGLGVRSIKSNGYIQNVFMNTSAAITGTVTSSSLNITNISQGTSALQVGMPVQGTDIPSGTTITAILSSSSVQMSAAATGSPGSASITYQGTSGGNLFNPNPAAGFALIQFKQNFNYYLGGFSGFVSAVTSPTTAVTSGLTKGQAYIITVLGTTTLAEWQSIGLTQGLTPTVGQSFIATATGTGGSHTGKVGLPGVSGITSIEVVGDPNQSINNSNIAVNAGALVLVQFLTPTVSTGAYVSPFIPTAPAVNSVVGMTFFFDGSSVTIDGL